MILAQSPFFNQAAHNLQVSASVSAFNDNQLISSFDTSSNLRSTQSEQNPSVSRLHYILSPFTDANSGFCPRCLRKCSEYIHYGQQFCKYSSSCCELFSNNYPQVTAENYVVNNFLINTGEVQMKIPVPQKPNPSPLFTGRKDVLDKLGKIFVDRTNNRPRRCRLLWGMGGIGKTQICLKFTEEMSDR